MAPIHRRLAVVLVVVALLWVAPAAAQSQGEQFTLEPGASATLQFEGFCAQFGEPFPDSLRGPTGLADEPIRAALTLARAQGLTGSDQDALQVQYAIWQLQGEQDAPQGGDLARDVLNRSRTAQAPAPAGATSLVDALAAGQVRVEVTAFAPVGAPVEIAPGVSDNFYGRGTLTVTNLSGQQLNLYMPVGTVLASSDPGDQDLVAYATSADTANVDPAQATTAQPTTQATAAPTAQATAQPTAQATAVPTNVQAAQPTPQPTPRPSGSLPNTSGGAPLAAVLLAGAAVAAATLRRALRR